jgi:hypothetical protein
MLLNPCKTRLSTIPGTRVLEDDFGLAGFTFVDPPSPERQWLLEYLLAPVPGRALGGIRARLVDSKGFVTFCNQRDLEVITGVAKPGDFCYWTGTDYPGPESPEWFGLCADSQDLQDDLHDRELRLCEHYPGILPDHLQIVRRVHGGDISDVEELHVLLWDCDPMTGYGPDTRLETVERRWARAERSPIKWKWADY